MWRRVLCFAARFPLVWCSSSALSPSGGQAARAFFLDQSRPRERTNPGFPARTARFLYCMYVLQTHLSSFKQQFRFLNGLMSWSHYLVIPGKKRFSLLYHSFYHPNYTLFVRRFLLEMILIHPVSVVVTIWMKWKEEMWLWSWLIILIFKNSSFFPRVLFLRNRFFFSFLLCFVLFKAF